jgi:hypothetical protein
LWNLVARNVYALLEAGRAPLFWPGVIERAWSRNINIHKVTTLD